MAALKGRSAQDEMVGRDRDGGRYGWPLDFGLTDRTCFREHGCRRCHSM
jgi:hypothetical protein